MNDPATRLQRAQLNVILTGAEGAHYSLPAALHEALRAEAFVGAQLTEARGRLAKLGAISDTTAALAEEVVEAARAGKPLADLPDRIAEAEEAERRARLEVTVVELAQDAAGRRVISGAQGTTIISEFLRPALVETLATVRAIAAKLGGVDPTRPETALRAPETARKALMALQDATVRHQALRTAQRAAAALDGGPAHDQGHWFSEFHRPDELGVRLGSRPDDPLQPWPQHPAARLLWLAALPEGAVWMPTPAEQDVALREWNQRTASQRPRPASLALGGF